MPVHFTYPTTAWVPGEPIEDVYDLPRATGCADGAYTLLLILYRAADGAEVGRLQLPAVTTPAVKPVGVTCSLSNKDRGLRPLA